VDVACEVDFQEAVLVECEGLRRPFDLAHAEVDVLLLDVDGLVDGILQLARGGVRG